MEESKILWESKYKQDIVPSLIYYLINIFLLSVLIGSIFIIVKIGLLVWPIWILLFLAFIIYVFSIIQRLKLVSKIIVLRIKSDYIEIRDKKTNYLTKKHKLENIERIEVVYLVMRGEGGTIPDYLKISIQDKSPEKFVYFIDYAAMSLDSRLEGFINTLNTLGFYKFPEEKNFWYRKLRPGEQKPSTLEDFSRTLDSLLKQNFKLRILNSIWKFFKNYI